MNDKTILEHISELVTEEKKLRAQNRGRGLAGEGRTRLDQLERELDQCWDLLRQRRALEEMGDNPDVARERPISEVEGYLQ